jgi:Flp pilus assembly protein TadG
MQRQPYNRKTGVRGNAIVEMSLIGIPIIFVLISIFEVARGMWIYHTLAYALKEGTRYAIVHGQNCSVAPNSCATTVGAIATRIRNAGVGLDPSLLQVQMKSLTDDTGLQSLSALEGDATVFPTGAGASLQAPITFSAEYPFTSALAMLWPGVKVGAKFGSYTLPASSQERIQF